MSRPAHVRTAIPPIARRTRPVPRRPGPALPAPHRAARSGAGAGGSEPDLAVHGRGFVGLDRQRPSPGWRGRPLLGPRSPAAAGDRPPPPPIGALLAAGPAPGAFRGHDAGLLLAGGAPRAPARGLRRGPGAA